MAQTDAPLEEISWRSPGHVASMGGYLHSNNILYYFAESPFFDQTSNNATIVVQSAFHPEFQQCAETRATFEAQLRSMAGIEFIVAHDPLEEYGRLLAAEDTKRRRSFMRGQMAGPSTPQTQQQQLQQPSNIWVIRKQLREKPGVGMSDRVTILATYFVIDDSIFMASSVYGVIGSRMLSSVTSLSKAFGMVSRLPLFSPAHGNTYMPPKEPENSLQQTDAMGESS